MSFEEVEAFPSIDVEELSMQYDQSILEKTIESLLWIVHSVMHLIDDLELLHEERIAVQDHHHHHHYYYSSRLDGARNFLFEESFDEDQEWLDILQRIKENDPRTTEINEDGENERFQNMTNEEWEDQGEDIASNAHLKSEDSLKAPLMITKCYSYFED